MLPGIHDATLVGLTIDLSRKRLGFVLQPVTQASEEFQIAFEGYEAHRFEREMVGSILDSVAPISAESIVRENWEAFEKGYAYSGWPGPWAESLEVAIEFMKSQKIHGFSVTSSYGLEGWVLAKQLVRLGRRPKLIPERQP
jgi:hypothetical protein